MQRMNPNTADIKASARRSLKGKWLLAIGVVIFIGIFSYINNFIDLMEYTYTLRQRGRMDLIEQMAGKEYIRYFYTLSYLYRKYNKALGIISLSITVLLYVLDYGTKKIFTAISRGKETGFSDVFIGFTYAPKAILAALIVTILVMLGMVFFVIPGIWLMLSYSMVTYLIADDDKLRTVDAMTCSRDMMNGHKMELLRLILSFIPWFFVIMFTFGLASIYVVPYMNAAMAEFYNRLKAEYDSLMEDFG